jgi:hypothetical protein
VDVETWAIVSDGLFALGFALCRAILCGGELVSIVIVCYGAWATGWRGRELEGCSEGGRVF